MTSGQKMIAAISSRIPKAAGQSRGKSLSERGRRPFCPPRASSLRPNRYLRHTPAYITRMHLAPCSAALGQSGQMGKTGGINIVISAGESVRRYACISRDCRSAALFCPLNERCAGQRILPGFETVWRERHSGNAAPFCSDADGAFFVIFCMQKIPTDRR